MHELLTRLLQANLAAAAAILAVLLLRKVVRAMSGARIGYALWLLVPLVAAVSLAPPRPAELLPAPAVATAPLVQAAEQSAAELWTWGTQVTAPAGMDPAGIAIALWLAGLGLTVVWLGWRQSQFMLLLRHGEAGPAVIGFLRPRIVTPADFEERFDLREQTVVLAHEKIHLARHDARINALVALARCVCWFNPMVHIGAYLMRVDQELACDAAVVARHPKARAPYAQALLKAQLAAKPLPLGCYWPAGTEHPLTERIAMLKRSDPSRLRRLTGAAVITALGASAGYAAWAAAPATAPAAAAPLAYIEDALTPQPEPVLPHAQMLAQGKAAPAKPKPEPAPATGQAQPAPPPAEVCASNACSQINVAAPKPTIERVTHVGSAPIPARQPFVKYFDGNSPVMIHGRVTEVRMTDGLAGEIMVQADDGKLYRIMGGDPVSLPADLRAQYQGLAGSPIDVRGYLAHDKSCEGGCLVSGREFTFPGKPTLGTQPSGQ